jgi:hypothetical protein
VRVEGLPRIYAIADEDLERENAEKTSSVHFLRFDSAGDGRRLKYGMALSIGVDHPACSVALDPVSPETRAALVKDLA